MNKRVCKEDQIKLIMECRQSGLSDYQWCEQNGIHSGTFYNKMLVFQNPSNGILEICFGDTLKLGVYLETREVIKWGR